jgi:DNA-binding response OmpR family regulator
VAATRDGSPVVKILLADDDTDLLDATTHALRRAGYSVVTAADGREAIERHRVDRPDLVLLDLGRPRMDGWEVCRRIRESAATPVIILTARNDDDSVVQGFLSGADDYVTKPFSHRQLTARVRAVLGRSRGGGLAPEPAGTVVVGGLRLDPDSHEVTVRGERVERLTPLEFRILYVLATNEGRVVRTDRLIEYAWGHEGGEASLVRTHVSHIRRKLGLDARTPGSERPGDVRVRTVAGVGYSLTRVTGSPG